MCVVRCGVSVGIWWGVEWPKFWRRCCQRLEVPRLRRRQCRRQCEQMGGISSRQEGGWVCSRWSHIGHCVGSVGVMGLGMQLLHIWQSWRCMGVMVHGGFCFGWGHEHGLGSMRSWGGSGWVSSGEGSRMGSPGIGRRRELRTSFRAPCSVCCWRFDVCVWVREVAQLLFSSVCSRGGCVCSIDRRSAGDRVHVEG